MMIRLALIACTLAAAFCVRAEESSLSESEVFNEGVNYYRDGDATNALRVLRPLLLSRSHGPRAAEIVAKLRYDEAMAEGCADPASALEDAAAAAQIALRDRPDDARVNRNFTRATDALPQLRETKRINDILKAAENRDPSADMLAATHEVRELMREAAGYLTNSAERAVALSDSLYLRASKLADGWIPVKAAICRAVTNEEQAATITMQVDAAAERTRSAAEGFAEMNPSVYTPLAEAETDFTRFLKLMIAPPSAMDEDLVAQSNAWQDVENFNGRTWQNDALDYTRAFRRSFPEWARAYERQAQADTNKPPFTAEDQAKISALATELEKLQLECVEKALPNCQEQALDLIRRIKELLPKDDKGGNGGQGNPPPNNDDKRQDRKNDENKQSQAEPNEDKSEEPEKQHESEEEDESDKDSEAVLKRAQERSDEHEAEKKARMRKAPLPPNERDW